MVMALQVNKIFYFKLLYLWTLFLIVSPQSENVLPIFKVIRPAAPELVALNEDVPVGTNIATVEVSQGLNPTLKSSSPYVSLTLINKETSSATYDVILAASLDYENSGPSIFIDVLCSNSKYQDVPSRFRIIIYNVNDEPPKFMNRPYSIFVPENTPQGTVVYTTIVSSDRDLQETPTYSLQANDLRYQSVFSIDPHNATIKLSGQLDFETTRFYQFTVIVKDKNSTHNDTADVFITVEDVQDEPPYFTGIPYQSTVPENSPKGFSLVTVIAADGDRGLPNSVALTIASGSTCPGLFAVDPKSGVVSLNSIPDRDSGTLLANNGLCHLRIEAKEGQEHPQASTPPRDASTVDVTITVQDVDDNVPTFDSVLYNASVQENTQAGVPINLQYPINVKDIDQGDNAKFEVRVVNLPNIFEASPSIVQSQADIIIRVKDSSFLDYEKLQSVTIMIDTKSLNAHNTVPATANITLKLINLNDEVPRFENFPSKVQIPEDVHVNFNVANITAKDLDLNDDGNNFGKVTYDLESPDQMFRIEPNNGSIFTKSLLDRELKEIYYITVVAEDGGGRKVTNQLTIELTDVNDNTPMFVTNDYQTSLLEEAASFIRPVVVHATDNDKPNTVNSQVDYSIIATNPTGLMSKFSINSSSGQLNLLSPLSYDLIFPRLGQGNIVVTVMAKDRGSQPLHSTVNVTVILQDINDKPPVCCPALYTIVRNESSMDLVTTVEATDADATAPNNLLLYNIDKQSAEKFIIDSSSGRITLRSQLDREEKDYYIINVTVTDLGLPQNSVTCQVTVNVTDINDTPPKFVKKAENELIDENKDFVHECKAIDDDVDPNLHYTINWTQSSGLNANGESVDGAQLKNWIQIKDPEHCNVTSVKPFDREAISKMSIVIQVIDTNGAVNLPQTDSATLVIDIHDLNDSPPQYNYALTYTASIRENMPINSTISFSNPATFEIFDDDEKGPNSEFQVILVDTFNIFAISPSSGIQHQTFVISVINSTALDYEWIQSVTVKVVAVNQMYNSTATVHVHIVNEDDNIPEFKDITYTASIPEESSPNTLVTNSIKAEDKDLGNYGNLSYHLTDNSGQFRIDGTTGAVYTSSGRFDRETKSSYTLTITAKDGNGFSAMTQLTVQLTDINDNSPNFIKPNFAVDINEDATVFQPSFFVQAIDADEPNTNNSQIEYTLLPAHGHFKINQLSGELTVITPLDFEQLSNNGVIVLEVIATDKGQPPLSSNATITVTVHDINDETPKFPHNVYTASVFENATRGQVVAVVLATDSDKSSTNNLVSYHLDALSQKEFSIDSKGAITVNDKLDREQTPQYNVTVTASDSGQPMKTSAAMVLVTIGDVNDSPPQFSTKFTSLSMPENSNKIIFTCHASDPDTNTNLRYSIDWTSSSGVNGHGQFVNGAILKYFIQINEVSGEVSPVNVLDRESLQRFQLNLEVNDINGLPGTLQNDTAILTVVVTDENDNGPRFEGGSRFVAQIQENMPVGSEVKLVGVSGLYIEDPDGENYNVFNVNMSPSSPFVIDPNGGAGKTSFSIKVADSKQLDYETVQNFTVTVSAFDVVNTTLRSEAKIVIQLMNENDNIPEFNLISYTASIPEDSANSELVTNLVKAVDKDLGTFGVVSYDLTDSSGKFRIDNTSGAVFTNSSGFDRETKSSYTLTITAKDDNGFSAMTQLTVQLTDINDNSPIFIKPNFTVDINEDAIVFQPPFFVQATDLDEANTINSQIEYTLSPGFYSAHFKINPLSGELTIITALDYEQLSNNGVIVLEVIATDKGQPPLSSNATITVAVHDINDETPKFDDNVYAATVLENVQLGQVVATVKATDGDKSSPNKDVSYEIDALSQSKFNIYPDGSITVKNTLDREVTELFNITVTASDHGQPMRTSSAMVVVTVVDVNDSPPQFITKFTSLSMPENSNKIIFTCNASDPDTKTNLRYTIDWTSSSGVDGHGQFVNGAFLKNFIKINEVSGEVSPVNVLDRESLQRFQLNLQVNDINGLPGTLQNDTAILTVVVGDENDNGPRFEGGSSFVAQIQENMPVGSEVKLVGVSGLYIEDPDGENNNVFNISMTLNSPFVIEPHQGVGRNSFSIKVSDSKQLDFEKVENFTVTVTAFDVLNTTMRSEAKIVIQLINENDNIPEFIGAPFKATIYENTKKSTKVSTIVKAHDADKGEYGHVSYYLTDDSKSFDINSITGEVYSLTDQLDRENQSSYIVTVLAKDSSNFTATTQLTIEILDLDDCPPRFLETNYNYKINEGEIQSSSGYYIKASDSDQPHTPNSEVHYQLIGAVPKEYSTYFDVNSLTGELTVTKKLDFELLSAVSGGVVNLTVLAQDQGQSKLNDTTEIVVNVLDTNDEHPMFQQNESFSLAENTHEGKSVGHVTAFDGDGTQPNNEIFYVIQSGSQDKFQINSTSGLISVGVGAVLDRESPVKSYRLTILAIDRGIPALSGSSMVDITILDVNDEPPVINNAMSLISIPENATIHSTVLVISAHDPDSTSNLQYSLSLPNSKAFDEKDREVKMDRIKDWLAINRTTGQISVSSQLDREKVQQIVLNVIVEDVNAVQNKPQTATASATIVLTDVNDNAPVIHTEGNNGTLRLNVSEGTKVGTEVTTLIATDADKNQEVTFSVINPTYFNISANGRLKLINQLDRETNQTLSFIVVATDSGSPALSSSLTLHINVLDINDNDPEFTGNQTVFSVFENANTSTLVGRVSATDKDEGNNAFVTFDFRDNSPFIINNITGEILVAGHLDRETTPRYTLTVLATDNPDLEQRRRAALVITIEILDINDNNPKFNIPLGMNYTGRIAEDRKHAEVVTIVPNPIAATDLDFGQNANVTYYFKDSSIDYFYIDPINGHILVNSSLNSHAGEYSLLVLAIDNGAPPLESIAFVNITIQDVNNESPYFINIQPVISIPECIKTDSKVYTFEANDNDTDKTSNGLVNFRLLNSTEFPDADYFDLDSQSGQLFLRKKLRSDQKNSLKIQVQAVDNGDPPHTSDPLPLLVKVQDINDHAPEFSMGQSTVFSVPEEKTERTEIGSVEATDKDVDSLLTCIIYDPSNPWRDYFDVSFRDGKCSIYAVKPFDRETVGKVTLNLIAKDTSIDPVMMCSDPKTTADLMQSEPITVTVTIDDINDNPPVYINKSMSQGFLSTSEVGKTILNLNNFVIDRDTSANSKHQFYQLGQLVADEDLMKGWTFNSLPDAIKVDINGSVKTNFKFPEDHYGAITLQVLVNDTAGNDTLNLKIFVVGSPQVVEFSFYKSEDELRKIQQVIAQQLSDESTTFIPDDIVSFKDDQNNVDGSKSILLMHAVQDGKIIDASRLKGILDYQKVQTLQTFKIIKTETQDEALKMKKETTDNNRIQYILIGIIVAITLTFVITLFMLIHNIRRFKRKLKAATIEVGGRELLGMDTMKFPGLENNALKDSNPIFMRDDVTLDSVSGNDEDYNSYGQRSENSLDKNAFERGELGEDEQEVTMNMYGGDDGPEPLSNPQSHMRYLSDVFLDDGEAGPVRGQGHTAHHPDEEDDDDDDDVFNFNINQIESTDI